MLVQLKREQNRPIVVNSNHVVAIYDQVGNQFGKSFCTISLVNGSKYTIMGNINEVMQMLDVAGEE